MKTKSKSEGCGVLIAYAILPFLLSALLLWYNHTWVQWHINYWQCLALSVPVMIVGKTLTPFRWVLPVIFAGAAIAQTAAWVGLLTLPIIK